MVELYILKFIFFIYFYSTFLRKWQRVEKLEALRGRLATPTLRINLPTIIWEFLEARYLPEDLDIRDEFVDNKMSKQKCCNLCPSSLDSKTFYKCLRRDKTMCKEHVANICCECAKNV